jgi:RNA polymerase sigma-70 factor (ECF subfamily)
VICLSVSDTLLIEMCQRNDIAAFNEIVGRYKNKIYNYIYRMVGNSEDAEDLTQEVFVKMYVALDSFRNQSSLSTWLYRIAGNLCIDSHRKRARRESGFGGTVASLDAPTNSDGGEEGPVREVADSSFEPAKMLAKVEMDAQIQEALSKLPDKMRTVVVLHDIEGLQYEEIAEVVHCPLGTVKSRLFNARAALREHLGPYMRG